MTASVLLRYRMPSLLDEYHGPADYVARAEARPAYQWAFAARLEINSPHS